MGPSADTTLRWFDVLKENFDINTHIIHDCGPEFHNSKVKEHIELTGVTLHPLPPQAGAFINPCDNSFNRTLKQSYYNQSRRTHVEMLSAIIKAYFQPTEEQINRYFCHYRIIEERPTRKYMKCLITEGYRPGSQTTEMTDQCKSAFQAWKHNLRQIGDSTDLIFSFPCKGSEDTQWHAHSMESL